MADAKTLFDQLLANMKKNGTLRDADRVEEAFVLSAKAHEGQKRRSGEPYINHPMQVAVILSELGMDEDTVIAGILHDVAEDTEMTLEDIRERFGDDVAEMVDGVTKLTRLAWDGGKVEQQAENLRKMFMAMAKDIRVIIIKLADRTHNMRTLQYMSPEKQREKARETMDIYAPLASRLGISKLKVELDNLALKYLEPEAYNKLVEEIAQKKLSREGFIDSIVAQLAERLKTAGIEADTYGRVKHYFSIYKKMKTQNRTLDEIYDLFAVRVIVNTVPDCYAALGIVHEMYTPLPGRFKDYVAMPKPNHYQSIHTTVIAKNGLPFEVQIRTHEMHHTAEYGIAAHWKYKEGGTQGLTKEEEKLSWLRQILEWQNELSDDSEFLNSLKNDLNLLSDDVYVFTPTGDVKVLPKGSTPIDFAYMVHSAVGNRMVGAKVNERLVPINYQLNTGDRVEIMTSQNSKGPSRDWLNMVASAQARNKINQWFRSQNKEENIEKGRELLERYCKTKNVEFSELSKPEYLEKVLQKYGFLEWNAVLAAIGHGGLKEGQVVNKLLEVKKRQEKKTITDEEVLAAIAENKRAAVKKSTNGVFVEGIDDVAVHFGRCCNPIPGDEIVGFITRGRGVTIHRTDCLNIINLPELERGRLISVEWAPTEDGRQKERYVAEIALYAKDRIGITADVSRTLAEQDILILTLRTFANKQGVSNFFITFETEGVEEINKVIQKLYQINGVFDIQRTVG
ncbi:MAG: bifunctional (p)ppGpp synthetase/guanosine-3',5'-bis(diphosphate) 3'-pyrophosphohydrolase [Lachnospiraceae bacterium]|nr:bifunctional (p)ppGpp synthetase/guanosine-3',5'-bis(diphosphate) 3'-pyrophosphohydrolase [Lachnospiraceae bacterium]